MARCKQCKIKIEKGKEIYEWISVFCSKSHKLAYNREQIRKQKEKQAKIVKKEKDIAKKKAKTEKRLNSVPRLIKKLDEIFSRYIRVKYSKDGYCTCISCEKVLPISEAQNAHWINRWCRTYRWSEMNCRPACPWCNMFNKEFHLRIYTLKQIEEYWIEKVNEMSYMSKQIGMKPDKWELIDMILYYTAELANLEWK